MVERNQAVEGLKKSVSLLRCSVERLQKMREEMNRMADRETAVAAKEAAAEVRLGEAARLERDLAHRLDKNSYLPRRYPYRSRKSSLVFYQ